MDWIETISKQLESDQELLGETGEIVCPCCNGTGTNPDYTEVNVILRAIHELPHPCRTPLQQVGYRSQTKAPRCLNCYGMARIDWVQYARGTYKQELLDWKKDTRDWFLRDIEDFLQYVHGGQVFSGIFSDDKCLHFDLEKKNWIEVSGQRHDINSLREAWKWLHKFLDAGYWDDKTVGDAIFDYQELYLIEPKHHLEAIKAELLCSKELSVERLIEIKNDLDLFWRDIESFNDLGNNCRPYGVLPMTYEFTWENILNKFGIPLSHLAFFNSEKVEPKK
jgi:hypothetical protein